MKVTNYRPGGLPTVLGGWSSGVLAVNSNFNTIDGGLSATNFVQLITANSSNALLRPVVNFAAGSNIFLTLDAGPGGSTPSNTIRIHSTAITPTPAAQNVGVNVLIDGGAAVITTGLKAWVEVPFAGTIIAARLVANASGSVVVDIWKTNYAGLPATVANTITASAKPTLSSAQKSQDTTLTGWTTSVVAGDWLYFNVDSVATITRLDVSLTIVRS